MPWLSIPPVEGSAKIKQKLAETLGVRAIPALAIIDAKTGEFVLGGEARDDVVQSSGDAEKVEAAIQKWKEGPRYPMAEGAKLMETGSGQQHPFFKFISWLAKNPMVIFGMIYFYQFTKRKLVEWGYGDEEPPTTPVDDVADTEF